MRVLLGILRNSLVLAGVGLALVALLLVLATAQPWLGLRLSADGASLGVQAVPNGPAAQAVKASEAALRKDLEGSAQV